MKFKKIFLIISIVITVSLLFSACGLLAYLNYGEAEVSIEIESELGPGEESGVESQPALENSSEAPAIDENEIIGNWIAVYREGDTIYTGTYTFYEDGTYTSGGCEYIHTSRYPEMAEELGECWTVAPMGYPYDRGTYTYADGVIELTCYGSDMDEYQTPVVSWVEISEYNGDSAVFVTKFEYHENDPRVFLKNAEYDEYSPEKLFEQAGVDYTP